MTSTGETRVVSLFHQLLERRSFNGVKSLVKGNKEIRNDWVALDQAEAICDVMIAAENRLPPNETMDYYGMIRVTRFGPVVLDDLMKLMKLLDGRYNRFPCSQEAAQHALKAWSVLSKPHLKAQYDLVISAISAPQSTVSNNPEPLVDNVGGGFGFGSGVIGRGISNLSISAAATASQSSLPNLDETPVGVPRRGRPRGSGRGCGRGRGRGGRNSDGTGGVVSISISQSCNYVPNRETRGVVIGGSSGNGEEEEGSGRGRGRGRGRGGRGSHGVGGQGRRACDVSISVPQSCSYVANRETRAVVIGGEGEGNGGGRSGDGEEDEGNKGKGKGKMNEVETPKRMMMCVYCKEKDACEVGKELCVSCTNLMKRVDIRKLGFPGESSFAPEEEEDVAVVVAHGSEQPMVVASDEDKDNQEETLDLSRAATVSIVDGQRVKTFSLTTNNKKQRTS